MMDFKLDLLPDAERKGPIKSPEAFGREFTQHMFFMEYKDGKWQEPTIKKLENFSLHPAALVFHYGQEIFEGLKAFRQIDGKIVIFRPEMNIKRFNRSADRLCMPRVDEKIFMEALLKLIQIEQVWVPSAPDTALYIRPTMIATEVKLGVHTSSAYYFYIILSPVGPYFPTGFKPTKFLVETTNVRAVAGGTGEAKTGGNYAATLLAGDKAKANGFSQVIWLDAKERKYVEEAGAMNVFFVLDNVVYTSPLSGSILEGVTRDSVIKLCKREKIKIQEKALSIDEIIDGIKSGHLSESFASGTAAVITAIGELAYKDQNYIINDNKIGSITQKMYDLIVGIQRGKIKDNLGWTKIVPP